MSTIVNIIHKNTFFHCEIIGDNAQIWKSKYLLKNKFYFCNMTYEI